MAISGGNTSDYVIPSLSSNGSGSIDASSYDINVDTNNTPTFSTSTKVVSGSSMDTTPSSSMKPEVFSDVDVDTEIRTSPYSPKNTTETIYERKFTTVPEDPNKLKQLLNNDSDNIQNGLAFPKMVSQGSSSTMLTAKYDYQIIPGKNNFASSISLENKLRDARKEFGIHVHGSNAIARHVKYYMYNRFKVPDTNLAFNKSTTHIFFTRPDLNLLTCAGGKIIGANSQTLNHSEAAIVYRRYPEIFKLLTDSIRCGDDNNFNFLLSNQVESFDIADETLTTVDSGKSWNEYTISYGDSYSGRSAGEFSCNFRETSDYSVINLLKLWITYIDNVSRGVWSPSYNLNGESGISHDIDGSHVYSKTLDYAASVYVLKTGPEGDDLLYWTKYYGVFPTNTGASALSWNLGDSIGDAPKLNIRFKFSFKRDLNPISIYEFNNNARISGSIGSIPAWSADNNECAIPFVGKPFIQMNLISPEFNTTAGGVNYGRGTSQIRLKFAPAPANGPSDDLLYKYSLNK